MFAPSIITLSSDTLPPVSISTVLVNSTSNPTVYAILTPPTSNEISSEDSVHIGRLFPTNLHFRVISTFPLSLINQSRSILMILEQ